MKKNIYATAHAAAAVVLVLLVGCDTITRPDSGQSADGKAAVSLSIAGTGARTVLPALKPDLSDVKAWKLLGGKAGEDQTPLTEIFTNPAIQTLYLETGDWDFTLKGYKDELGGTLILEGAIPKQALILGGPNVLEFTVAPVLEGTGTVKITITLPAEHSITQVKVFKDSEELEPITPTVNSVVYEKTGHDAGDYYYRFLLYKGEDLYGTVSELVQVRANLASEKTYTLEKEDLNIRYAITYEMDNGTFNEDDPSYHYYQYTDADFTLPTPTRGDYDFLCWYAKRFSDIPVAVIPTGSTGDRAFYAEWTYTGQFLTSTTDIENYLRNAGDDNSAENPVILPPVNINLADGGWADLLSAISGAGKYAALDLSACTGMTEFDPKAGSMNSGLEAAKGKIVSLVLPNAAESVKDGGDSNPLFTNFSALKSVVGKNVKTVGRVAFEGCNALVTVTLPKAVTIGDYAFSYCTALETVNLPKAAEFHRRVFQNTNLKTVELPEAATIGTSCFWECTSLTTVTLGSTAPTLGNTLLSGVSNKTITVRVPYGATGYTSSWQNSFKGGGTNINLIIQTYNPEP